MKRLLSFFLLLFLTLPLIAQTNDGTFTGTVTDPVSRRIVGANIVIKSLKTGVERTTRTNEAGVYTIPSLDWVLSSDCRG